MIENTPIYNYIKYSETQFVPINATIEVGLTCNLKCTHCYNFDRTLPQKKVLKNHNNLSNQEIKRVIGELSNAGTLFVSFTGGEPLAHPDIFSFIQEAREKNMAVKLKTNGTYLTEGVVSRLKGLQVQDFDVSVYGHDSITHDAFTKKTGSFAQTIKGLRNLKKAKMLANISFIINKLNYKYLDKMKALANSLNFRFIFSLELTSRNDGSHSSKDYRLDLAALEELYRNDHQKFFKNSLNKTKSMNCACALTNVAIASNGNVYPCIGAPINSGNIREGSFSSIWKTSAELNKIRQLSLNDFKDCKSCHLVEYCQRSSGAVYMNTGSYTGSDPWTCGQAQLSKKFYHD